jgi:hypothetical protein
LIGSEWVRLTRTARNHVAGSTAARRILQFHWVVLFAAALAAPVVTYQVWPQHMAWAAVGSATIALGVLCSAWGWRRGADAGALIPLVTAWSAGILILYGAVGPHYNAQRSHRTLAATLERIVPPDMATIMFFRQIDEGLWFYLRDRTLSPVPGSQPRYNAGADLDDDFKNNRLEWDPNKRAENVKKILVEWLTRLDRPSSYVLLRTKEYDLFARDLADLTTLVHREHGLYRNELVLLRVAPGSTIAAKVAPQQAGERTRQ